MFEIHPDPTAKLPKETGQKSFWPTGFIHKSIFSLHLNKNQFGLFVGGHKSGTPDLAPDGYINVAPFFLHTSCRLYPHRSQWNRREHTLLQIEKLRGRELKELAKLPRE